MAFVDGFPFGTLSKAIWIEFDTFHDNVVNRIATQPRRVVWIESVLVEMVAPSIVWLNYVRSLIVGWSVVESSNAPNQHLSATIGVETGILEPVPKFCHRKIRGTTKLVVATEEPSHRCFL